MVVLIKQAGEVSGFHPDCWLRLAEKWVAEGADTRPKKGRVRLDLSPEDRARRLSLLRKYAAVTARILKYEEALMEEPGEARRLRVLRLYVVRMRILKEIEPYGGPPKSWLENPGVPERLLAPVA